MEHIMCSELLSVASYDRITEFLIFGLWIPSPGTSLFSPFGWLCRIVPMHCSFGNLSDKCSQVLICSLPFRAWLSKYFPNAGTNANQFFKKRKEKKSPKGNPKPIEKCEECEPNLFPMSISFIDPSFNKKCNVDLGWKCWNFPIYSQVLIQWTTSVINILTLKSSRH